MWMSLILLMLGLLAWWQLPDQWLSLPMIGFALAPIFPATIWLIPKQLPASLVPAAVRFATSAASVGAAMIPSGVGWIASWSGLGIIPMLMIPLAIAMIVLHWANSRHHKFQEAYHHLYQIPFDQDEYQL
jgi:fucose permease